MSGFLNTLLETFTEFQQHEQIENRFIMDRLKRRLNALSVYNSAVCNCHQDNRLTEVPYSGRRRQVVNCYLTYALKLNKKQIRLEYFLSSFFMTKM